MRKTLSIAILTLLVAACGGEPETSSNAPAGNPRAGKQSNAAKQPAMQPVPAAEAQAQIDALEAEPDPNVAAKAFLAWAQKYPRRVEPATYRVAARTLFERSGHAEAQRILEVGVKAHPTSNPLQSALAQVIEAAGPNAAATKSTDETPPE